MKKKKIFITVIVLFVFLVGLYFLLFKNNDKIILNNDEFVFELGEDISADISFYVKDADCTKNINEYKLSSDVLKINNNKFIEENNDYVGLGEYKITIVKGKTSKQFLVKVVDTISPEFTNYSEVIELETTTDKINLNKYFSVHDLTETTIEIVGEYDLTKAGKYLVNIIAYDSSNNKTEKEATIIVKEKPVESHKENNASNKVETPKKEESKPSNNNSSPANTPKPEVPVVSSPRFRKDISDQYIIKLNEYRKANGLNELPVTAEAQAEADRRAKEISTYYSHDGVGYAFGENIGEGSVGVDFFVAWKNSPSHNAAMLREQNTAAAASVYEINNHWYAVMSFKMDY